MTCKPSSLLSWILRSATVIILLWNLFLNFSAAPESVAIFSELGIEPSGRIGSGCLELLATILILYPKTTSPGTLLAAGIMTGAIIALLTRLGNVERNYGGELFTLALAMFLCSCSLLLLLRKQLFTYFQPIYG